MESKPLNAAGSELALIGAILASGIPASQIIDRVPASAFSMDDTRHCWDVIRGLVDAGSSVDLVTIADAVDAAKHPRLSPSSLAKLYNARPTWTTWESDADRVVSAWTRRQVTAIAGLLTNAATDPTEDIGQAVEQATKALRDATEANSGDMVKHIREYIPSVLDQIQRAMTQGRGAEGVQTGFVDLDRTVSLRPGEMTILAARPSIGKTAIALNMATNVARTGQPAGVVSLEMTAEQLTSRVLQGQSGVSISEIADNAVSQRAWDDLQEASEWIANTAKIYVADLGRAPLSRVKRAIRDMAHRHGCVVAFVDYMQLVRYDGGNRYSRENEVSEISGDLKGLAQELKIPIVVLCQLNRQAEDVEPKMSNLRESGAIEQDADVVLLLHRVSRDATEGTLAVAKQRNGEAGQRVRLMYSPKTTTFSSAGYASQEDAEDMQGPSWVR